MTEPSVLERRYQRLLAAYPPAHRRVHGEEMVGVLLASAQPHQRWPGIADAADLIAGAALIRFRALRGQTADSAWRDAFALLSVIAPILMLADGLVTTDLVGVAIRDAWGTPEYPFWLAYPWNWSMTLGPAIVVVLALLGWRRTFAVAALVTTAYATFTYLGLSASMLASPGMMFRAYLGLLAAAGAMLSPGPRRGTEILRWWGVAVVGLLALVLAELSKGPEFDIWPMQGYTPLWLIGASLVLTAAVCLISRTGHRVLALLAIAGVPYAGYMFGLLYGPAWWQQAMAIVQVLLPALLVIVVAIAVARARRARPGPPQRPRPAG